MVNIRGHNADVPTICLTIFSYLIILLCLTVFDVARGVSTVKVVNNQVAKISRTTLMDLMAPCSFAALEQLHYGRHGPHGSMTQNAEQIEQGGNSYSYSGRAVSLVTRSTSPICPIIFILQSCICKLPQEFPVDLGLFGRLLLSLYLLNCLHHLPGTARNRRNAKQKMLSAGFMPGDSVASCLSLPFY